MEPLPFEKTDFLEHLFNAIPTPIFIVDNDVRILYLNTAAIETFGFIKEKVFRKRGGDALNCIHSTEDPGGCGHAEFCKQCAVRNSVGEAIAGHKVIRKKTKMEFLKGGEVLELYILVTASPLILEGSVYSILILEDISELLQLRSLLPICSHCKKIRDDENYWEHVESYIETHVDVQFSHSICPDCAQKLYPEVFGEKS